MESGRTATRPWATSASWPTDPASSGTTPSPGERASSRRTATHRNSPGHAQRHVLPEPQLAPGRRIRRRHPGVVRRQPAAGEGDRQPVVGQPPARLPERRPGEVRHRMPLACVEGGVVLAGGADGTGDAPVRFMDVDEGEPLHFPRRGPHGHHGGLVVALPLVVAVVELDLYPGRVTLEGPQWISARTLHRGKTLLVDENRDSRLEQRVEGGGFSLFVVVVLHESVVAQENRCEAIEISRNPVRGNGERGCPRLCLAVIGGIGEELLEPCDITDRRLLGPPVQPRSVPLLKTAVRRLRRDLRVVPSEPLVLLEEGRQRGNSRGDGLHQEHRCVPIARTERQNEDQQDGDPPNHRFPGPVYENTKRHYRSPRRFPRRASCY